MSELTKIYEIISSIRVRLLMSVIEDMLVSLSCDYICEERSLVNIR